MSPRTDALAFVLRAVRCWRLNGYGRSRRQPTNRTPARAKNPAAVCEQPRCVQVSRAITAPYTYIYCCQYRCQQAKHWCIFVNNEQLCPHTYIDKKYIRFGWGFLNDSTHLMHMNWMRFLYDILFSD